MTDHSICSTAIARLFSASVVRELATRGKSPIAARLLKESGLLTTLKTDSSIANAYDAAFDQLKLQQNRHEYIYKAAITQKVLLGVHNLDTASMLTEFRIRDCKADVVVLNGTGTVYEIKSERDTLARLQKQVEAYLSVFATVNVIVGQNHLEEVLAKAPSEVGVMVLTSSFKISQRRMAVEDASRTCPLAIFDALSINEAERLLRDLGKELPVLPNTRKYRVYREMFRQLAPAVAHEGMVETLKKTRSLSPLESLLRDIPSSLYSATLCTRIRRRDHGRFAKALQTPLYDALNWV